ncbi:MAG: hypothetical protein HKO66_00220 [Saprospiraceae bacterium]|nr:hypothetical protein [Bacteroidia bacterium]NNE15518.1 hypothetical protein [Saprospiraceae bacterium]NNL90631.1 hypothetical protein [Saprospiraceae bacterium]
MKKSIAYLIIIMFASSNALISQIDFGVKMGVHSFDLSNPKDIILPNDESIKFTEAELGFQGGIYAKFKLGAVSLEPRLMLNTTSVKYTFNGDNGGIFDNIKEESFTNLDIPVLFGFNVLMVNALIGPVAHLNLNSTSDLFDISGYDERFKTATYGFRLGFCIGLGNVELGLEYEGNFSEFGDHINIGGQSFSFDDNPSRLIFNIGIPIF